MFVDAGGEVSVVSLCAIPIFNLISNLERTQNFKISYFHKFY